MSWKLTTQSQKFQLTKQLAVEVYLGLQRLINRNKVKKWRKHSNDIPKRQRHVCFKPFLAPVIFSFINTLCDITDNNNANDALINAVYDDIGAMHKATALQNTKTRVSFLKEDYLLGASNVAISSEATQKEFENFQHISQRNGLSNNHNVFERFTFSMDLKLLLTQVLNISHL